MAPRDSNSKFKLSRLLGSEDPNLKPDKRNPLIFDATAWLKLKAEYDGIDSNLWRINDDLYDLAKFARTHPGGKDWIEFTKGTDITEAFEVAHVFGNENKSRILEKYHVKSCKAIPRKHYYTFEDDGFYNTLKRRVQKTLKEIGTGPTVQMLILQDGLALSFHALMFLSIISNSTWLALLTGFVLGMTMASSHNFFHQADNFRRFYWDLTMFSSYDWKITHMMSHHLHTNTLHDFELVGFHPLADYTSFETKSFLHKFISPMIFQILLFIFGPFEYTKKCVAILSGKSKFRPENLIPLIHLLCFLLLSESSIPTSFYRWLLMHSMAPLWLGVTTLLTTHHHPAVYSAGDVRAEETDWGLQQVDCVRDVGAENLFVVATTLKHHLLHHLFPTVDHSKLHLLYPDLEKTCREFGVSYKFERFWYMAKGHYEQLARSKPQDYQERLNLRSK